MKRKLLLAFCALLIGWSNASAQTDVTSTYITNPSFEDGNTNGWTVISSSDTGARSTSNNTYKMTNSDGNYLFNTWWKGTPITQTIANLPAGYYTLSAIVASDGATIYMIVNDDHSSCIETGGAHPSKDVGQTLSHSFLNTSIQNVKIGVVGGADGTAGEHKDYTPDGYWWYKADNFKLYKAADDNTEGLAAASSLLSSLKSTASGLLSNHDYDNVIGTERTTLNTCSTESPSSETISAYTEVIAPLQNAISAYTAAKTNYDALVTEIAKAKALGIDDATADGYAATSSSTAASALGSTQNLMVAEYNYATENYATPIDLGSWTETGTNTMPATFSNEHWSGETREYKNQNDSNGQGWNASSWSMGLNQDITLPAGDYVFKVAGRKSADATMTLTVTNKATEAVLGTIADFPSGNSSRGINKSGATAFEGDNEDFAHDGAGFGWQWRYVPFSLNEETTVNIAVTAGSSLIHNWASFGDYAVWSKPNVAASTIAYNKAVEDAGTAKTTYPQVTGTELTELNEALGADKGSTVETIDAATAVIKTKTSALIAAAPSYDAYLLAKGYGEAINSTLLPYASTTKLTAVTTALSASVTNAEQAATAANNINTANRAAYESNMNAEGIAGATNRTSLIKNADGNNTAGWSGSFGTMSNEPYTEADGNTTNTYFDKNGIKSFTSSQTIKLVAGTYILSVTARAQANIDSYKLKVENSSGDEESVNLTAMGNANGVFNRGWNVATVEFTQKAFGDATISIVADNTTSNAYFWMSWDRFRLVSIAEEGKYEISEDVNAAISNYSDVDVTLTRTIKADTWNTFVVPFAINNTDLKAAFGNDVAIAEYSETADGDNSDIAFNTMATPAVAANTPVLLKTSTAGTSYTFTERNIVEGEAKVEGENYDFVGSYMASINLEDGDYFISSNNLYKNEGATVTLKGTRAYIKANGTPNNVKILNFIIGDGSATGIEAPEVTEAEEEEILYNTAGVRVGKDYKGIVINQKGEKRLQK